MKTISLFLIVCIFSICYAKKPMVDWKSILVADTLDIYIDGKPSGLLTNAYIFSASDIEANVHVVVENNGKQLIDLLEKRVYNFKGNLKSAYQEMKSHSGNTIWELSIDDGVWNSSVITAGARTSNRVVPVNEHLRNVYAIYSKIKSKTLQCKDVWTDTVIELTSGERIINTTKCAETPSKENSFKWVLINTNSLQRKDERWVLDTNGHTIYHELGLFVAVKRGYSLDSNLTSTSVQRDLFETFVVHVERAPTDTDQISLLLDSSVQLDSSVLSMYKKENGTYILNLIGCTCSENSGIEADSLKEYLKSTATLQKDHPDIIALEKKIHNKRLNICQRIKAYNSYVFEHLKKQNTATFSSAVETLHAGFGDCGEHSVLCAALLRASGIPARVVLGLVYIDAKKGYFGHAWVMAFTGKQWIFADPSHNVFPACQNRIPLLIDDTGQKMIRLITMIGKIRIEYVYVN